ncbi:inactive lrr receptor-like serine/threonine-protein kinase bir2 [Quercus suber]|uniref:Inactive lrr receptor-like serine/threonine-protein kinase bir2 n=1 Tax=Quercus suber TaxID=58331 RepID=A0AAW0K4R7_QUESU
MDALDDPYNHLTTSWNFNKHTEGFICQFIGIKCWHHDEKKVINIF